MAPAMEAADMLAERGIETAVVNARYAKPLDEPLISGLAGKVKCLVTVEENALSGGFGCAINNVLLESGLNGLPVKNIGVPDRFIEHGTQAILRAKYGLDAKGIAQSVIELLPELDIDRKRTKNKAGTA